MKKALYIFSILAMAVLAACSDDDPEIDFNADTNSIEIGPDGGTTTIKVSSPGEWVVTTDNPWISVSPANGRGITECEVRIDSALTTSPRTGTVRIQTLDAMQTKRIDVTQQGYEYIVQLEDANVSVPNYAAYGERSFEVTVLTNTEFEVSIPDNAGWLTVENPKFNFDRQARPRKVTLRFNWQISSQPERIAEVNFLPAIEATRVDKLTVTQEAAPPIEVGTHAGDSVALLGIARSLNTWESWESSEPMSNWSTVTLWEEGMDGWTPENDGRVKSATFTFFETKEGLPYEVQYLTAAEELSFMSNVNSFLLDLDQGEYITMLPNLKKLTMMGYGLSSLTDDFANLKSLEYLDMSANNFELLPPVLTQENFPNLKHLILNAQQRALVYDLSNDNRNNLGGFYASTSPTGSAIPRQLLEWDNLKSLVLGVNYLQGQIPDLSNDPSWTKFYTEADVAAADSLPSGNFPTGIVGLPKVWPNMTRLTINYNRITGNAPDWLLYHPALDWWIPFTFIFNQEGKDETGRNAGFDNEPPTTMEYYYNFYPTKENPYADVE